MAGKKGKVLAIVMLLIVMALASACSKNNGSASETNTTEPSPSATAGTEASASPSPSASAAMEDGPLGKYSPPITVTTVRGVNVGVKFKEGDSLDSNIWTKSFESDLGITVKNEWKVSDQQFKNKINVSMVAGDLPDFFEVDPQQLQLLVDAGQIADLTDAYNKYASDLVKQSYAASDGIALQGATFDGKIMALPINGGEQNDMQMLYVRKDWLDNLNLQVPKTMDDVINVALAFTNDDPDGDKKKNTWGLSVDYNLFNGWSGLDGFFNGYHAYPFNPAKGSGTQLMILKGDDGKPALADVQPEVKTALGKLQELFKAGAINPEFSVIDGIKSAELATSGKVGMTFGATFVPSWPINNMQKDNPKVEWVQVPLVSADSEPAIPQSVTGLPSRFMVVNAKSEHPEALIKLLNYYDEKLFGENADESYHIVVDGDQQYGIFSYAPIAGGIPYTNVHDNDLVIDALKSGDTSKLTPAAKGYYDKIKAYEAGDLSNWASPHTFGPGSAYDILGSYIKNNQIVASHYYGQPTETMVAKGPSLRDLEAQVFTKIIMGTLPIDAFDTEFVAKWHEQGGDQILQEIADSGKFK